MGLNIRHFLWLLAAGAVGAIFWLKPHHVSVVDKRGIPQVLFEAFTTYEITPRGVESYLHGQKARKFGRLLIVDDPVMNRLDEEGEASVTAREARILLERSVTLRGDVRMRRSDGWRMETPYLQYDIPRKRYSSAEEPFVIHYGRSVVHGRRLRYDAKRGTIEARSIRAKIHEEDR